MSASGSGELTALAPRLALLVWLRLAAALLVAGYVRLVAPQSYDVLLQLTGGYAVAGLLLHLVWSLSGRRALLLVGGALLMDGVYLAVVAHTTGAAGPGTALVLLHLVAVTLLASYRTGAKLVLWHGLLLVVVHRAPVAWLPAAPTGEAALSGTGTAHLAVILGLYLAAAGITATAAAASERELRRRRYDLEGLAELSRRLEGTTDSFAVTTVLADALRTTFDFPRVVVLDVGAEQPDAAGNRALVDNRRRTAGPDPQSSPLLRRALQAHRPQLLTHLPDTSEPALAALLPDARNILVVPMYAEGRAVAVTLAEHSLGAGPQAERRVVAMTERFCAQAALALANAQLLDRALVAARSDGLTGLANRRTFDEVVGLAAPGFVRTDVALLLLDLDHFKNLNDELGHQGGDDVLRQVAALIAASCRTQDTAARYGGEEFAVVLPGCGLAQAAEAADRLRRAIAGAGTTRPITISVGVAVGRAGDSAHALVASADAALYTAKRTGRNRVCRAGDTSHLAALPAPSTTPTGASPTR